MSRLSRAGARCAARLVPARRRDWVEALWAESGQVPSGPARLAWRAGGVRLIVREALLARRAARVLRYGAYAAVLVLALAKASAEQVADNPAAVPYLNSDASVPLKTGMIYTWLVESLFVLVVAVYVAGILALTARRPRVAPATLAAGTGMGVALGAVMYAVAPLGLTRHATNPWLPGPAVALLVLLAWVLLLGGPVLAGLVAARCYRGPGRPEQAAKARGRQAAAAGFLAAAVGALMVTVLGTVTVVLMPRAGWVLHWLYPGQHLTAAATYLHVLTASVRVGNYGLVLVAFPVIGLIMGLAGGGLAAGDPAAQPGPPPGGGPPHSPGRQPAPHPPGGGRLADARTFGPAASLPRFGEDSPDGAASGLPWAG